MSVPWLWLEGQHFQPLDSPLHGFLKASWQEACSRPTVPPHGKAAFLGPALHVSRRSSRPGSPLPATPHIPVSVTYPNCLSLVT